MFETALNRSRIMYSQKLRQEIQAAMPNITWSLEETHQLATLAGLTVYTEPNETVPNLVRGNTALVAFGEMVRNPQLTGSLIEDIGKPRQIRSYAYAILINETPEIVWSYEVYGQDVICTPMLWCVTKQIGEVTVDPAKAFLEAAGELPRVVKLSEDTVTLPRAPWDNSRPTDNLGTLKIDTLTCLVSEAEDQIRRFVTELYALVPSAVPQS